MVPSDWQEQAERPRAQTQPSATSPLLPIFLLTILLPISLEVAGLRLSPTRLYLLIFSVPFALKVLRGEAGRITIVDLMFILSGVWVMLSLVVVHGTSRIPFAGITVVELVGGYFVGRVLVRNSQSYNAIIKFILLAMVVLLPFALVEAFTGKMILPDLLRMVFDAPQRTSRAYGRMGLERVYSVFAHPILFGLFCSIAVANVFYLFANRPFIAVLAASFTIGMSFLSLSSAPLLACAMQIGLLIWNRVMGGRWILLLALVVATYVVVDLASNRTPITILIDTVTFNSNTGWIRIAINNHGWASVKANPIFGLGFNEWIRPYWLTSSVDNFWLLTAMRYGAVGLAFFATAFLLHMLLLCRVRLADANVTRCRTAHGIVLAGICFTLVTVHIWDTMSAFVMFFVGAGAWIYTPNNGEDHETHAETNPKKMSSFRYSRFDQNKSRPTTQTKQQGL